MIIDTSRTGIGQGTDGEIKQDKEYRYEDFIHVSSTSNHTN